MGAAPQERVAAATARDYARHLLGTLGADANVTIEDEHPALAWKRSGMMALTGRADGAPQMCPAPIASLADGALAALTTFASPDTFGALRGSELLAERAALTGFTRNGAISPGGSCRLLDARDGRVGVNLARDDDWALLPAWLEDGEVADWDALARVLRDRRADELVARARLLGLAVALDAPPPSIAPPWLRVVEFGDRSAPSTRPLVVDLSSLWAGPLCGRLLHALGAEVIKVESAARPDGARVGSPEFFERLNAGKDRIRIDFADPAGLDQLRALLLRADIVIEASRPRALRQLGIEAEAILQQRPGMTWLSLTAYGLDAPQDNWIGFGDDVGVAAGLSWIMEQASGEPLICGDAIADPLAGMHAALAAWACHRAAGGRRVDVSLHDVTAHAASFDLPRDPSALRRRALDWARLA